MFAPDAFTRLGVNCEAAVCTDRSSTGEQKGDSGSRSLLMMEDLYGGNLLTVQIFAREPVARRFYFLWET